MLKTCSICKEAKPLGDFAPHPTAKHGVRPECRICRAAYNRAWREANQEKAREISRAAGKKWYAANAEKKKRAQRERRERTRKDPDAYAAWREQNKESCNRYYAENSHRWPAHRAKYRANKHNVEHTPYTRLEIWERDGGKCRNCNKPLAFEPKCFHIDHIVPLSLGGPDIPANLQLMCPPCNISKKDRLEGQIHLPV
jgi:5-methylcytosine-specific restriction endonuclease McrA